MILTHNKHGNEIELDRLIHEKKNGNMCECVFVAHSIEMMKRYKNANSNVRSFMRIKLEWNFMYIYRERKMYIRFFV